jgi:hypothetical protein
MEEAVTLMSAVLPTWDKVLARQPSIFHTLVKISWKASFFNFPMNSGSPRYLAIVEVALKGRMLLILLMGEAVVFLLNSIEDLAVFTSCPNHLQ